MFSHSFREGSSLPGFKIDPCGMLQILFKDLCHLLPKKGIEDSHVALIVVHEGLVIEVGRADDAPGLVEDIGLGVEHLS